MANTNLNFETFLQDAHEYVNGLAIKLGHPEEKQRVLQIWRAVMHSIRDRIDMGEAFQVMDPLPMILKGIYVQNWKYNEKPPLNYNSLEEMKTQVKQLQKQFGEEDFPWSKSTEEIISETFFSLKQFMGEAQLDHLIGQMPKEIQEYLLQQA